MRGFYSEGRDPLYNVAGMGSAYVQLQLMVHLQLIQMLHVLSVHQSDPPNIRAASSTEVLGTLQFNCSLGLDWLGCGCS